MCKAFSPFPGNSRCNLQKSEAIPLHDGDIFVIRRVKITSDILEPVFENKENFYAPQRGF